MEVVKGWSDALNRADICNIRELVCIRLNIELAWAQDSTICKRWSINLLPTVGSSAS